LPVKSQANAEHYTWGDKCDGWFLAKSAELAVIHERMPPDSAEVLHRHNRARQFFFVLRGEAAMTVDKDTFRVMSGEGIEIDPGVAHRIRNVSHTSDLEFLAVSQPPSHGDRFNLE
jgi:mannose-6-phosphate isomerase-like protein (cupin superfamily)